MLNICFYPTLILPLIVTIPEELNNVKPSTFEKNRINDPFLYSRPSIFNGIKSSNWPIFHHVLV